MLSYVKLIDKTFEIRSLDVPLVTVSPKYQVVIPRAIREALGLRPGQKMQALQLDGRVELIPVPAPGALRGMLRGIDTRVRREGDRV